MLQYKDDTLRPVSVAVGAQGKRLSALFAVMEMFPVQLIITVPLVIFSPD